jgi:addiction module RelB/DinJ family antitoxin
MSTVIHLRVPAHLKKAAQKIAAANGLDLSSVIRMYLVHMEVRGTIPLPPLTVNGYTEEAEQEILRRMKEPVIKAKNMKEYFKKIGV